MKFGMKEPWMETELCKYKCVIFPQKIDNINSLVVYYFTWTVT